MSPVKINALLDPVRYVVFDVGARIGHHPAKNVDNLHWERRANVFDLTYAPVNFGWSTEYDRLPVTQLSHTHATWNFWSSLGITVEEQSWDIP